MSFGMQSGAQNLLLSPSWFTLLGMVVVASPRKLTRLELELREQKVRRGELANAMGVSRQVLNRWMAGREAWPTHRVTQAAELLGVDESVISEGA